MTRPLDRRVKVLEKTIIPPTHWRVIFSSVAPDGTVTYSPGNEPPAPGEACVIFRGIEVELVEAPFVTQRRLGPK